MINKALEGSNWAEYSFTKEFVDDMIHHIQGYWGKPISFFKDLQHGCVSGMIGVLIYNDDCKNIYIKHIDDMESCKENMEDEYGCQIENSHSVPHYTFLCWLCYEELGFAIARALWPDEF